MCIEVNYINSSSNLVCKSFLKQLKSRIFIKNSNHDGL